MIPHNANLVCGREVLRGIDNLASDFNPALGLLHRVVVDDIADVSEVHSASGSKCVDWICKSKEVMLSLTLRTAP